MPEDNVMLKCPFCPTKFQFGPHRYDGKTIPRYRLTVCMSCYEGNWDGWNHAAEEILLAHLDKECIPVPRRGIGVKSK